MSKDLKSLIVLFKAHQSVLRNVRISLEESCLSVNEFAALEALHTKGTLTTQNLIKYVLIPNSSMTHVLDTLEKKSLIIREKDEEDRRIQYIRLTTQGYEIFESVYSKHFEHMRTLFDVLTDEEETRIHTILKKLGLAAEEKLNEI